MLAINEQITIPEDELSWSYARSGGPGGQNVNKVASKAVLRWQAARTTCLPLEAKARLLQHQRSRLTTEGELLIVGQRFRDQERNRQDCLERLRGLVLQALIAPKPRKVTKPSRASKARRVATKRRNAGVRQARRVVEE